VEWPALAEYGYRLCILDVDPVHVLLYDPQAQSMGPEAPLLQRPPAKTASRHSPPVRRALVAAHLLRAEML
jgi:hypothetical protein